MNQFLELLSGKKTYCAAALIGALLFGNWQGWWKIPPEVYSALMALGLCFLRNGIKSEIAKVGTTSTSSPIPPVNQTKL
jgi:hypothetical protein